LPGPWPQTEASRVYYVACAILQREFNSPRPVSPRLTLVLGEDHIAAARGLVDFANDEIRMDKYDKRLFAQGVIMLGFYDWLSPADRLRLANRAVD